MQDKEYIDVENVDVDFGADIPSDDGNQEDDSDKDVPIEDEAADNGGDSEDDGDSEPDSEPETEEFVVETEKPEDDESLLNGKDDDNGLVKHLRKLAKEKSDKLKELNQKVKELEVIANAHKEQNIRKKPNRDDYIDLDQYDEDLIAWNEEQREVRIAQHEAQKKAEQQEKELIQKIEEYERSKSSVYCDDYESAEAMLAEKLTPLQREVLLQSDNPARVVAALYKYPHKVDQLSTIRNSYKFAIALSDFESKIKIKDSKSAARVKPPEKVLSGSRNSGNLRATYSRLQAEAERSGNYTELISYKVRHGL